MHYESANYLFELLFSFIHLTCFLVSKATDDCSDNISLPYTKSNKLLKPKSPSSANIKSKSLLEVNLEI